jgi:hypothetical protein
MASGVAAVTAALAPPPHAPDILTVTNTNDSGPGSLRQAILDADSSGDQDNPERIVFAIPGGGVQTIKPLSRLPDITTPVILDGTTEPGYVGRPIIELDGSLAGFADGLRIIGGNSTVRGLVIDDFRGAGIDLESNHNIVESNYIGTDATGTLAKGNGIGITVQGLNNRIGADSQDQSQATEGNLISGNDAAGIVVLGVLRKSPPRTITRELKETLYRDVPEVRILPDGERITVIERVPYEVIHTETLEVYQEKDEHNLVAGNLIGTDWTGQHPLGNGTKAHVKPVFRAIARTITVTVERTVLETRQLPDGEIVTVKRTIKVPHVETYVSFTFKAVSVAGGQGDGVTVFGNGNVIGGPWALANTIAFNAGAGVDVDTMHPPPGVVFEGNGNQHQIRHNFVHDNAVAE